MPRKVYDPKAKTAFLEAARGAIKAEKGMDEALKAAKEAGYGGGMSGLKKMLWPPKKKAKKRAKVVAPAAPALKKNGQKRYDPKVKAAFLAAAGEARKAGKPWVEAYEAAKKAGYTGSKPGLVQQFLAAVGKKGKKAGGRKRGRRARLVKAAPLSGLDSIQQMVDQIVAARVNAAIEKAIGALEAVVR